MPRRALTLVLLIAVTAELGACSRNPSTGRLQLDLISDEAVAAMGVDAMPQLIDEYGGESPVPELRQYVDRVGYDLAGRVEREFQGTAWEFTLLDSEVINAFALPGGKVFLSRGLLERLDSEAQVAGVLGHEIGHVTGKHVDERLSQTLLAQFGMAAVQASTETALIHEGAAMLAQGTLLKFGRDQEAEADIQGLKYMTRAGYNPRGMYEVLEVLRDAAQGPRQPEFLSTHPHPETRLRIVTDKLNNEYAHTQGDPSYRDDRDRFEREVRPYLPAPRRTEDGRQRRGVMAWCAVCRAQSAG